MKKALIFGITGQDGSYLAELLLSKQYTVIGIGRRSSTSDRPRIEHLIPDPNFILVEGDITDCFCVGNLISEYQPDEIYNLAAQSHVGTSFSQPSLTWDVTAAGCLNILEAIRHSGISDKIRFYQASSSEMFGKSFTKKGESKFQDEETPFLPQSPYAVAKLAAHHAVRVYRQSYDMFACCGILFNHESERRGELFVTRKITKWIGKFLEWESNNTMDFPVRGPRFSISEDLIGIPGERRYIDMVRRPSFPKLRLGNLDARRDWGHAEDYVEAMWLMLQQDIPEDYVVATGETHSIKEFLEIAFNAAEISSWKDYVTIDKKFYRPAEVDYLLGDASKAKQKLGWEPKNSFDQLVERMVRHDVEQTVLRRSGLQRFSEKSS